MLYVIATVTETVVGSAGNWMDSDDNADVVNVLVTTGQLVPTLGKLLLFKLDGAFKATCEHRCLCTCTAMSNLVWSFDSSVCCACEHLFRSTQLQPLSCVARPNM